MQLAQLVEHQRCIAIVGMEKNAGKTTVLNHLLEHCVSGRLAITSIGYDGEDTDQVTGTAKPGIYVRSGTLLATAAGLLGRCDITRELLKFTGFHTAMGEVILVRALSDGFVQIAGPAITAQMEKLVQLFNGFNVDKIFIDGAAARKSTAAISAADACILATGAAFSPSFDRVVEQTAFSAALLALPVCNDEQVKNVMGLPMRSTEASEEMANRCYALTDHVIELGSSLEESSAQKAATLKGLKKLLFKGACPARFAQRFLEKSRDLSGLELIVRDGTRFLFTSEQYKEFLRRRASLKVMRSANLLAITVNPQSPAGLSLDSRVLQQRLCDSTGLPVFDVCENRGED